MVEVRFTPTESEVTGALRAEMARGRLMVVLYVLIVLLFVLGIAVGDKIVAGVTVIFGPLLVAVLLVVMPVRSWDQLSSMVGEFTYTFADESVETVTPEATATAQWSLFTGAFRTRRAYVLKMKGQTRLIVPIRAFATPADEQAFRELVNRKVSATL